MKNYTVSVYLSALILLLLAGNPVTAQPSLPEKITGEWDGEGTLMGASAQFGMQWEKVLGGRFLKLTFRSRRTPEGGPAATFDAIAFYSITGDSILPGTWFDSRGISFPVEGTVSGTTLTVEWGTPEIERGRTVYALEDENRMVATDYVLREGAYAKFGEARYQRVE